MNSLNSLFVIFEVNHIQALKPTVQQHWKSCKYQQSAKDLEQFSQANARRHLAATSPGDSSVGGWGIFVDMLIDMSSASLRSSSSSSASVKSSPLAGDPATLAWRNISSSFCKLKKCE
jgi:hypothetical protein